MPSIEDPARTNVLGVGISAINMEQALNVIEGWIATREHHYVCITPVHSVMECQKDPELRRIFNSSGLSTPDGMPLVWLSKLAGFRMVERVYGPDLMIALCERSIKTEYRHFFYGGREGVPEKLIDNLKCHFAGLQIAGAFSPPFNPVSPKEEEQLVQRINETKPHIVWVGLGAPKQERWMAAHVNRLDAPVLIGVGAAFDFHSGLKRQAPLWMRRSGLEWLFRLATEPRRLWRRYLINNPLFLALVMAQLFGINKYESLDSPTDSNAIFRE